MFKPTPSDGVVLVSQFRTMRLKQPTDDLMYVDGKLCMLDSRLMVPIAAGNGDMNQGTIYELDLVKKEATNMIVVTNLRQRVIERVPNSSDVVKRAVTSTNKDLMIDATLLDVISMSFFMRERVYTMAQAKAHRNKRIIVRFGVSRFQE